MSRARTVFYEAITAMSGLLGDPLFTDKLPFTSPHNTRARILRNGLTVSAFSALETYIEDRLDEKIVDLSTSRIVYGAFDDRLRRFFSIDAISGLNNRISFLEKPNKLSFAETHLPRLAGFMGQPPQYTGLGFSPKGSNMSAEDIQTLLSSFGISDPWKSLSGISADLGASRVSLRDDFLNFVRARNKAAHDSTANTATADLQTFIDTALLVGIAADIAFTNALSCFTKAATFHAAVAAANKLPLQYRFLDQSPSGHWNERVGLKGRVIKRYLNRENALRRASLRRGALLIVVRDLRSIPVELI